MVIVLNIGNTYSRAALWDGVRFELQPRVETARLTADSLPAGLPVIAATVVPEVKERLAGREIRYIDARNCGGRVDFTRIDYASIARGFGIRGYHVEDPADLKSTLQEALAAGVPAFVNVVTEPQMTETPPVAAWERTVANQSSQKV